MRIRSVIGLTLFVIVLKILVPTVLSEFEKTLISILRGTQAGMYSLSSLSGSIGASSSKNSAGNTFLPQATQIRNR